ncbi:inactive serine/threonine-protein kinase TEX14 [Eleutherodactylus coqui]|uniref:inactive serine/threonine-protein kinase TEX14 n=1 Tax=Eleutherodactylus coqui TaxID=57060 RepID=UPI003461CC42
MDSNNTLLNRQYTAMTNLSFCTFNVRGINAPAKRGQVLSHMHKKKIMIVMLQETHYRKDHIPKSNNKYYTSWYHSTHPDKKICGTSIAIHKNLPHRVLASRADREGRYIFLRVDLGCRIITVANVYFPNTGQIAFGCRVMGELDQFAEGSYIVLGGDFNLVWDAALDTSTGKSSLSPVALRRLRRRLSELKLVDLWRTLHPEIKDFSHHSIAHNSYGRLDYLFVSHGLLDWKPRCSIGNFIWLDHAPVYGALLGGEAVRGLNTWRLNDNLLGDPCCLQEIRQTIESFIETHKTDTTSPTIQWEALKCVLRGVFISHGSRLKKDRVAKLANLISQLEKTEQANKTNASPSLKAEISTLRQQILGIMDQTYLHLRDRAKGGYYEYSNKCSSWLARALNPRESQAHIFSMNSVNKGKVHATSDILECFREYYGELYNIGGTVETTAIDQYLQKHAPTMIPIERQELLEEDMLDQEILTEIKNLKIGKSPGPDGFTPRFYKTCGDLVVPLLGRAFNAVSERCPFPYQALQAIITVIPKPGKDPMACGNYRPISLLNVDTKLFAKTIATRLRPIVPGLVHRDQVGFVAGREARDNTIRTLALMGRAREEKIPLCLLSVDAEKAFDRVNWRFLEATLRKVGLGKRVINWIMALYNNPTAQIRVNGRLSNPINIKNGTRQGCPLSLTLYALVMESLANALRENKEILGYKTTKQEHKVALFADDLLVYITNPNRALPAILKEFDRYSRVSNFKINLKKSDILNITLPTSEITRLKHLFPLSWREDNIRYLGVILPTDPGKTYDLNYEPIYSAMIKDFERWRPMTLSWFGRISVIKMNSLPKLLYIFQTLPIQVPRNFFVKLQKAVTHFVWGGTKPRLSYRLLTQPKKRGGTGLPDLLLYYRAAICRTVLDVVHEGTTKRWVELERELATGRIRGLFWLRGGIGRRGVKVSSFISSLLKAWDSFAVRGGLVRVPGPWTPLRGNPDFPQGDIGLPILDGLGIELPRVRDVVDGEGLIPLDVLLGSRVGVTGAWFQHYQIGHYVRALGPILELTAPDTPFEGMCGGPQRTRGEISAVYGFLVAGERLDPGGGSKRAWEKELGRELTTEDWAKAICLTHKMTISSSHQELNYKLLTRWYRTPVRLAKYYPGVSDLCWRCQREVGTLSHIWWSCPQVRKLWREIEFLHNALNRDSLVLSPEMALLSILPGSIRANKNGSLRFFLLAMRTVIPRLWRSREPPTRVNWVTALDEIGHMEELRAKDDEKYSAYHATWEPWLTFRNTTGFGQWLFCVRDNGQAGFMLTFPFIEEKSLVRDESKPTFSYAAGPFMTMTNYLQHPLILQLLALSTSPSLERTQLVFERVTFGSFYSILHEKRSEYPILHLGTIVHILLQMIEALVFLHWRGFIHRSFSSHAIQLVTADRAKISNFEYMVESKVMATCDGIIHFPIPKRLYCWASPEIVAGKTGTVKSDLYSFCVVMQESLTDSLPWNGVDGEAVRDAMDSGHYLTADPALSEPYYSLVSTGIQARPKERTTQLQDIAYMLKNDVKVVGL